MLLFISFSAEETPRFCHALFQIYVLVKPSLAFSLRDGFHWTDYLNEITAKPGDFCYV